MIKLPRTITTLIEIALNRYLQLDPEVSGVMHAMSGKVIKITIRDLDIPIIMQVSGDRINVLSSWEGELDSEMRASLLSLMKLGMSADAGASAMGGDIEMSGNLEAGRQFRDLLSKVDIDWEEILSQYTGDIVAHKIGNSLRSITQWGRKSTDTLQKNLSEYLQEESRQLPSQYESKAFMNEVDEIRLATDRAEARIKKLAQGLQAKKRGEAQEL